MREEYDEKIKRVNTNYSKIVKHLFKCYTYIKIIIITNRCNIINIYLLIKNYLILIKISDINN